MTTMAHVFMTVDESIQANAERFIAKAEKYFAEGKVEHAVGCLRKAKKNYDKVATLREATRLRIRIRP
jgi:predicted Zn-dependent protease